MDREQILKTLRQLNHWWGPVVSVRLAAYLEVSERTLRYHLLQLELVGDVCRPRGRCSGWVVRAI